MRERYYLLKRQNKIKTTMRLSAAMVFLSMLLCACTEASQNQEMPAATYMGGKDTIADRRAVLMTEAILGRNIK